MAQYIIPGAGFFDDGLDQRSYMAPGGGVVNEESGDAGWSADEMYSLSEIDEAKWQAEGYYRTFLVF